ncbi:MAG TPA: cytochrome C oxidase subunit IV family protein [Actinomycetota bacterium]
MADTESRFQEELGAEDLADPREALAPHREHPSAKEYIRIGVILAVLTALEVASYYVDVNTSVLIPTLFGLALVKFVLVVLWFMHLRFDDRRYARFFVMGLALAATLYLIVLISFRAFLV